MNASVQTVPAAKTADRFEMLDLLRGIAALAVLIYHSEHFLGIQLLPDAYLAVDLFFMLSGFVIAHNYDPKIGSGMTLKEFMLHRGIRLLPCYWLALVIGVTLGGARMIRDEGYVDSPGLITAALCNLVMLPSFVRLYGDFVMFPFNGASWSLMYELVANLAYWLIFRFLNLFNLIALLVSSAVALVLISVHVGSVDIGMRAGEELLAAPRVIFSFFAGLALRRYAHDYFRIRLGNIGNAVAVLVLIATFRFADALGSRVVGECVAILAVFPLLLLNVSNTVPGPRMARICRLAGNTSYPVYILQTPLMFFAAAVPQLLFHEKGMHWGAMFGVAEISFIVVVSWWVDAYFELPARKWLKRYFFPKKQAVAA
jgi:peptidoglycan/LPS O-acetylase OafA/YrhL